MIYLFWKIFRSSPYDEAKKNKKEKNVKNKITPFLIAGPGTFFDKNPYFCENIQPPYKIGIKQKYKGLPFVPPSTIKRVSDLKKFKN